MSKRAQEPSVTHATSPMVSQDHGANGTKKRRPNAADAHKLTDDQVRHFKEKGWVVIHNLLNQETCTKLQRAFVDALNTAFLSNEQHRFEVDRPESFRILTDASLRTKLLKNPNFIFRGGEAHKKANTRAPRIAKSNGMVNFYWLPQVQAEVQSHPTVHNAFSQLLGTHRLIMIPERLSVKAKGSESMKQHLDTPLFAAATEESKEPPDFVVASRGPGDRVQGFAVFLSGDDGFTQQDRGNVSVVEHFHHYWALAKEFFHPERGYPACRLPPVKDTTGIPFFLEPKNFRLEFFNMFIRAYTQLHSKSPEMFKRSAKERQVHIATGIESYATSVKLSPVPQLPLVPLEVAWRRLHAPTGSLVLWDNTLPHRSLANKQEIPRMVAYVHQSKLVDGYEDHAQYHAYLRRLDQQKTAGKPVVWMQGSRSSEDEQALIDKHGASKYFSPAFSTDERAALYERLLRAKWDS